MPATKDEIAAKFLELAIRFGHRRAAVEDVARELHISKKTIYEHFSSKDALLRYALELSAREQRARVESLLTEQTVLGRVQQVISIALADTRRFYQTQPPGAVPDPPGLTAQINELVFQPMVCDLIVQGVEAGEFDVADPEMTASFTVAMGTEAVRMIRDDPSCHPEAALMDAVRRLVAVERSR